MILWVLKVMKIKIQLLNYRKTKLLCKIKKIINTYVEKSKEKKHKIEQKLQNLKFYYFIGVIKHDY